MPADPLQHDYDFESMAEGLRSKDGYEVRHASKTSLNVVVPVRQGLFHVLGAKRTKGETTSTHLTLDPIGHASCLSPRSVRKLLARLADDMGLDRERKDEIVRRLVVRKEPRSLWPAMTF
jgi:hypothetical protein